MRELKGGNLDIDLIPGPEVPWEQDACPWNKADNAATHKCAVKNVSICKYFEGIKEPDIILCSYGENNDR